MNKEIDILINDMIRITSKESGEFFGKPLEEKKEILSWYQSSFKATFEILFVFFYIVSAKFYFVFGDNKKWPYFFEKLIAEIRKKYPSPIMDAVLNSQRIGFLPEYFQKNGFGAKVSDILYNTEEYKDFTEYMKNEEGFESMPVHMEMADIAEIVYMKRWQELRSVTVDLLASAVPTTFITPYPFSKDLKDKLLKDKNGIKKINSVVVQLAKYSSKNNDDISWYCSVEISYLLAVYSSFLEEHYIKNK